MFIYKLNSIMFSLKIHLSTVFQFFQYLEESVGSWENEILKYRKETNIFFLILWGVFILIKIEVIYGLYKYKHNIRRSYF